MPSASVVFSGFIHVVAASLVHFFELLSNISLHQFAIFDTFIKQQTVIDTLSQAAPDACYLSFSSTVPLNSKTLFPCPSWQHGYLHSFIKTLPFFRDPQLLRDDGTLRRSTPTDDISAVKLLAPKTQRKRMK